LDWNRMLLDMNYSLIILKQYTDIECVQKAYFDIPQSSFV